MTVKNITLSHLICRVSMVVNSSNIPCSILPIFSRFSVTREVKDSGREDKCLKFRLIPNWLIMWEWTNLLMISKILTIKVTKELLNLDRAKVSVEVCPTISVWSRRKIISAARDSLRLNQLEEDTLYAIRQLNRIYFKAIRLCRFLNIARVLGKAKVEVWSK